MAALNDNSRKISYTKVTIGASTTTPSAQPCKSCLAYHFSGTGTYLVDASGPALPTSFASAVALPIQDLSQITFGGTQNDVVMLVWRE